MHHFFKHHPKTAFLACLPLGSVLVFTGVLAVALHAFAFSATLNANPVSCAAPCSPEFDWTSDSPNIVAIYKNGAFLWNQNPNSAPPLPRDWNLSAGIYTYDLHVIDSDWTDAGVFATERVTVFQGTLSANPTSCAAPCSPAISWTSNPTPNIVSIYKNGVHHSNQTPTGSTTDWNLSAGTYIYTLRGVDASWNESGDLASVTVNVSSGPAPTLTPTPTPAPTPSATATPAPTPTAITATLSVNPATVVLGTTVNNTAMWAGNSNPAGLDAFWNGTKNSITDAVDIPVTDASSIRLKTNFTLPLRYDCSMRGTYTRFLKVRDAAGNTKTSNTVTFAVTDPNNTCAATPTPSPSSGPSPSATATPTPTPTPLPQGQLQLNMDKPVYTVGERPFYTITGASPFSQIRWSSWLDTGNGPVSTGEVDANYGQVTLSDGTWSERGGAWEDVDTGFWVKEVNIGGQRARENFTVQRASAGVSSCSVSFSKTDICVGDTVSWTVNSAPGGLTAYWHGTYDEGGVQVTDADDTPNGELTGLPQSATYTCAERGTYTRKAHIAQGGVHAACTTNALTVSVRDCTNACVTTAGLAFDNDLPPPPSTSPCVPVSGFSTQCFSTSDTFPVMNIADPRVSAGFVDFTLKVVMPETPPINAIWNIAYFWSEWEQKWFPRFLVGAPYPNTSCPDPTRGCWLRDYAEAPFSLRKGLDDRNGALYVVSWQYTYQNRQWQGPPCAASSQGCWRLAVFPERDAATKLANAKTLAEAIFIAKEAGLEVKTNVWKDVNTVLVRQPLTRETLAAFAEMNQVRVNVSTLPTEFSVCEAAGTTAIVNIGMWEDGWAYGIHDDYNLGFDCSWLNNDVLGLCDSMKAATTKATNLYNAIAGIPHASGGSDRMQIGWTSDFISDDILGRTIVRSTKNPDGTFQNTCEIKLNTRVVNTEGLLLGENLPSVIQHEMGHCFGLLHDTVDPGTLMAAQMGDTINQPRTSLFPVSQDIMQVLREMKNTKALTASSCDPVCASFQKLNLEVGGKCECINASQKIGNETGQCECTQAGFTVEPVTGICVAPPSWPEPMVLQPPAGGSLCIAGTITNVSCTPPDRASDRPASCMAQTCGGRIEHEQCFHLGAGCYDCGWARKRGSCYRGGGGGGGWGDAPSLMFP